MFNRLKKILLKSPPSEKEKLKANILRVKSNIKIIVGAGNTQYDGWISSEQSQLNILNEEDWQYLFTKRSPCNILAEHVWEHLSLKDGEIANAFCYKYLAKGGKLRLAVPDGFFPDTNYIDYVRPGGTGAGADDHKVLYNYELLKEELEKVGFKVELVEYWDEDGNFHFVEWDPIKDGMIQRSKRFDERNLNGELKYTSLIVDAIKY